MAPIIPLETVDDNRLQILDAAEQRYRQYGYGKTTMAEIAEDVGMSAANLYRYFKNKNEIGAACAQRCMGERITLLRNVVRTKGLNAAEKLRRYTLESLRYSHENASCDQKINELVQNILSERKDLVYKKVEEEIALITEILSQGNSTGEFDVSDVVVTARNIQTAIIMFNVPTFMGLYPLEDFEVMANGVIDLILSGINPG
ncbi:MAG: TetR/AcrR family transcriptional regulator [Gammaproteobacteria bacterium]